MTLCASFPQASQPLSLSEKQLIWAQLGELKEARLKIRALTDYIADSDKRQKLLEEAYQMKLDAQAAMIDVRTKERDLALERAAFYEQAYKSLTKKGSWKCKLKRIFTFGIARPCK